MSMILDQETKYNQDLPEVGHNPTAILLITVGPNETEAVSQEISKIPLVETVHQVIGPYDLIVHLKSETVQVIRETVKNRIWKISGVKRVHSHLIRE